MYARRIEDKTYTFRVSGKLWGNSLVMNDLETNSDWSHHLGKAMAGSMKGTVLQHIPSVITSWKAWKTDHPESTVSVFQSTNDYYTKRMYGDGKSDDMFTVGLRHRGKIVSYPLKELRKQVVIADQVEDDPIIVCYDSKGTGTKIFRCTLDGQVLHFLWEKDRLSAGDSTWSITTGIALDGPLQGKKLEELHSILSMADAWLRFHPQGRIYGESAPAE